MNMTIHNNVNTIGTSGLAGNVQTEAHIAPKGELEGRGLTITHAVASADDIAAAEIPESTFVRDDALGRLVGEAFSFPPPPIPAFPA